MSTSKYKIHNGTTVIAEKSLGTREILNTNHGRDASIKREQWSGHTEWVVTIVCNGIADYSKTFKTRREAMADYESL